MIGTVAAKELRSLFGAPLAWIVLAVLQILFAYIFLVGVDRYRELQPQLAQYPNPPGATEIIVAPVFGTAAIVLLMVVPLLSMRLIAEERRNQTLTFLISAPVSTLQIVLGKFFGLLGFLLVAIALIVAMAVSLYLGGRLDLGLLATCVLGLVLLSGTFSAVGLYLSSLTSQPLIAAISAFAVLLGLWIVNLGSNDPGGWTQHASLLKHFESFGRGTIDTGDLAYFGVVIVFFLWLTARRLDRNRLV